MPAPYTGGCQCGKIRYLLKDEPLRLYACHCTVCQQQSGSVFGMSMVIDKESVEIKGKLKCFVRTADSGNKVASFFCLECGNRIYAVSPFNGDTLIIKPGTLDGTRWLTPSQMIWMESAQKWVPVPNSIKTEEFQSGWPVNSSHAFSLA